MENSTQPIRVLNLFTTMNRGGAESMCMNLYRNIDRSKVQFDFLVHRQERGLFDDEIEAMGGRIYRLSPIYPQYFAKYKKELRQFFKDHPEYKIIHSNMSELGYFAIKAAKKAGVPVRICHAHGAPNKSSFDKKMIVRTYFKHMIAPYLTNRFACGELAGKWLFNGRDDFYVLNNAIDTELYKYDLITRQEVRKEYELEDSFVVGIVGRFNEPKNPFGTLAIFDAVLKKCPNAKLLWVGDGAMRPQIEEKIKEKHLENNVILAGIRSDVYRMMQAMDAFIMPSLWEGLPVVGIEAQAAGLKCYFSESVTTEVDVTDRCAFLPLNNPNLWADKILNDDLTREDTSDKIKNAGYDIHTTAKWLEEFYLSLV